MVETAQQRSVSRRTDVTTRMPASSGQVSFRSLSTNPKRRLHLTDENLAKLHISEMEIAAKLNSVLSNGNHRVALISRVGCDLSRFRFEGERPSYTHTGFAIRDYGDWRVYQLLNTHAGREGHLYWQSLADFFRDDPHEYRCAVLVPSSALQYRLLGVLGSPVAQRLYNPKYNRVAFPFSTRYQNSNQWVLEVIAAAQSAHRTRREVQDYLAEHGISPTILRTAGYPVQAVVAMFNPNTRFDDHPLGSRLAGRLAFITETSIRTYLKSTDRIELEETIRLGPTAFPGIPVQSASMAVYEP